MTLFGRDSLLTSWMALPLDPTLALGTLQTLAALQGTQVDPRTEEEPGRILHEIRFGADAVAGPRAAATSTTARPTPPRCSSCCSASCAGGASTRTQVDALLPHADRALRGSSGTATATATASSSTSAPPTAAWSTRAGRTPGTASPSPTARSPRTPIALCEVQGYVYAAYLARAALRARRRRRRPAPGTGRTAPTRSRRRSTSGSGCPTAAGYALALDGDKRPVDALHLQHGPLPVDRHRRRGQGRRRSPSACCRPEMFTGWGVRTLASDDGRVQPDQLPQRLGVAARQRASSRRAHALRLRGGGAADRRPGCWTRPSRFGGRLPELFCGFDRAGVPGPGPVPDLVLAAGLGVGHARPAAADAAAAWNRGCLADKVWFAPAWPDAVRPRAGPRPPPGLGGGSPWVIDGDRVELEGLPDGVEVIREPRAPVEPARPGRD